MKTRPAGRDWMPFAAPVCARRRAPAATGPGVRLALLLAALALAACATSPTGRPQLLLVSPETAISVSAAAYSDTLLQLRREDRLLDDPSLAARVDEIAGRVVAAAVRRYPHTAQWQWSVALIDAPDELNAWCMAGGRMALYSGIVYRLQLTDDELAQVIGHEVSHAIANHTAERMSVALVTQLGLVAVAHDSDDPDTVRAVQLAAQLAVELPNSRAGESEADRLGMELAALAGYQPAAAASVWEKMAAAGESGVPRFLSTHPSPDSRRDTLAALARVMQPLLPPTPPAPHAVDVIAGTGGFDRGR